MSSATRVHVRTGRRSIDRVVVAVVDALLQLQLPQLLLRLLLGDVYARRG